MARARVSARRAAASAFQESRISTGSSSPRSRSGKKAQNVRVKGGGRTRSVNAPKPL